MKFQPHFLHLQDSNVRGQKRIKAAQDRVGVDGTDCLDIGHLGLGVYARVGSAGTGQGDRMIEQFFKGFLHHALHRREIGLDLPAVESSPIVRKGQLEVPHRFRL